MASQWNQHFKSIAGEGYNQATGSSFPIVPSMSPDDFMRMASQHGYGNSQYQFYTNPSDSASEQLLLRALSGDPQALEQLRPSGLMYPDQIQYVLNTRAELASGTTRAFADPATGQLRFVRQGQPGWNDALPSGYQRVFSNGAPSAPPHQLLGLSNAASSPPQTSVEVGGRNSDSRGTKSPPGRAGYPRPVQDGRGFGGMPTGRPPSSGPAAGYSAANPRLGNSMRIGPIRLMNSLGNRGGSPVRPPFSGFGGR